jgi:hypothetical protein
MHWFSTNTPLRGPQTCIWCNAISQTVSCHSTDVNAHTIQVDNKGDSEWTFATLVFKTFSETQHTIDSAPNVYLVHCSLSNCEMPLNRCAAHTIQVDNKDNCEWAFATLVFKTLSQHQHTIESAPNVYLVHCSLSNSELPLNWCAAHTIQVDNKGNSEWTFATLVFITLSQHQHTIESAPTMHLVHCSLSNCELPLSWCAAHTIQVDSKGNSEWKFATLVFKTLSQHQHTIESAPNVY